MLIARKGNFGLVTSTYLTDHIYTTHDLDIVKYQDFNGKESCYVIAEPDDDGNIISIGNRLIDAIEDDTDLEDLRKIIDIVCKIIETDNIICPAPKVEWGKENSNADFIGYSC